MCVHGSTRKTEEDWDPPALVKQTGVPPPDSSLHGGAPPDAFLTKIHFLDQYQMDEHARGWRTLAWELWEALERNPLLYQQQSEPTTPVYPDVSSDSDDDRSPHVDDALCASNRARTAIGRRA